MATPVTVTIRGATLDDVPGMAEVAAAGFLEDGFFGDFLHPHRREFPDDWKCFWQKRIWTLLAQADSINYVCVDNSSDHIVAMCLVKRMGGGASKLVNPITTQIQRASVLPPNAWEDKTWTDHSADPVAQEKYVKNWDNIAPHFSGDRKECWLIDSFCVHPDFQRKGLGRPLLQKAVDLGKNEEPKVPVGVISSAAGEQFYAKFGFEEVGRGNVGDLAHLGGGSIRFYERHIK